MQWRNVGQRSSLLTLSSPLPGFGSRTRSATEGVGASAGGGGAAVVVASGSENATVPSVPELTAAGEPWATTSAAAAAAAVADRRRWTLYDSAVRRMLADWRRQAARGAPARRQQRAERAALDPGSGAHAARAHDASMPGAVMSESDSVESLDAIVLVADGPGPGTSLRRADTA